MDGVKRIYQVKKEKEGIFYSIYSLVYFIRKTGHPSYGRNCSCDIIVGCLAKN